MLAQDRLAILSRLTSYFAAHSLYLLHTECVLRVNEIQSTRNEAKDRGRERRRRRKKHKHTVFKTMLVAWQQILDATTLWFRTLHSSYFSRKILSFQHNDSRLQCYCDIIIINDNIIIFEAGSGCDWWHCARGENRIKKKQEKRTHKKIFVRGKWQSIVFVAGFFSLSFCAISRSVPFFKKIRKQCAVTVNSLNQAI